MKFVVDWEAVEVFGFAECEQVLKVPMVDQDLSLSIEPSVAAEFVAHVETPHFGSVAL